MPGRFGPSPHPAVHPTADRVLLRRKSITVRLQQDDLCARLQLCPAPRPAHWPDWIKPQNTSSGASGRDGAAIRRVRVTTSCRVNRLVA